MRSFRPFYLLTGLLISGSYVFAAPDTAQYYRFIPENQDGYTVVTSDAELPAVLYLEASYGLLDIQPCDPLPDGILAKLTYADGSESVISGKSVSSSSVFPLQGDAFPAVANTCVDAEGTGFPYEISGSDLPYQQTFDTTLAVDTGDYRGSAADAISRPGGHDGFWTFTPAESGTYFFQMGATKGDFVPIPDHADTERGFASVGVWSGECGGTLEEAGIANSLLADSQLSVVLEAGVTYTVIWEDFFVGSTENSVTLSVEFLGSPAANSIADAISLVSLGWNFEVAGDSTVNQNLEDGECVEGAGDSSGHGSGTAGVTGAEVWYRLPACTPGSTYTLTVSEGEGETPFVDSVISLHSYNLTTHMVTAVDCNDDAEEGNRFSALSFTAEAGLLYYVMVESKPDFDQLPFGQFVLKGVDNAATSSVGFWEQY